VQSLPHTLDSAAIVIPRRPSATYSRSLAQAEDVTLFERDGRRTISMYPSPERVASRGASYNEDDYRDYDVIDYDIEVTVSPLREFIDGRARVRLRARAPSLSALTLLYCIILSSSGKDQRRLQVARTHMTFFGPSMM
jgi:hypothetical protein